MFDIGSNSTRTCAGVSRRSLLRIAASAPMAFGLGGASAMAVPTKARAKSVIFVFLWGAPSHLDTCDPKPDAPSEYRGPYGVIPTRTPGVHFTELLPKLAQQSHRFNLLRTHVTSNAAHPPGGTVALTGFEELPGPLQPNFGSIVARHKGNRDLPGFMSIGRGSPRDVVGPMRGYGGGN